MSTDLTENETDVKQQDETKPAGLLLELENSTVAGRRIMFDVIRGLVGDKGSALTPAVFSRFCLHHPPARYLPNLMNALGKKGAATDDLAAEISQGIVLSLKDKGIKAEQPMLKILKTARVRGVQLGALTALDEDSAAQLVQKLGLADMNIRILSSDRGDRDFPTADVWLKLAKMLDVCRGSCTVLATSSASCKAALSAGMRCVAMPDEFTSFQDLSGADLIVENPDEESIDSIMSLVTFVRHW